MLTRTIACIVLLCLLITAASAERFRPPAVPLVTHDPYLSIWSEAEHLNDAATVHWTEHKQSLTSLIRIDGITYRLMGDSPASAPPLPQRGIRVLPTRSIYEFADGHVHVTMTFLTPALPDDLGSISLPLSYITWQVRSTDGKRHAVSVYDSASAELAVNTPDQAVVWGRTRAAGLSAARMGTAAQTLFKPAGDQVSIDWGYAYLAGPSRQSSAAIGNSDALTTAFAATGHLPANDDPRMPRKVSDGLPTLALCFDLGSVASQPVRRHAIVAYDEVYGVDYFGDKLRPYWRRNGTTPEQMLTRAERTYPALTARCARFDAELTADLTRAGGARYAQICALAYRQAIAACGLVADRKGKPLLLTKENTSNGDIATVDVFFPMDPVWLLLSPSLAKASLVPILTYAASPHWHFPNAPHDLGTYPVAEGRDDGGEAMPVEESGNMLILCDAVAHADGDNAAFAARWWPQLTQWARFLEKYGLDPGDQLCTDDFMGHLAHNANLSVKAIIALAAYGDLCRMHGDTVSARKFMMEARADARHWIETCDTGDHSLLAFDKPGTWSQKYNLVWDRILGLNVFPPDVARKEVAFYKRVMQPYGLPLDSRTHLTKTDWSVWSATLAGNPADFQAIVAPIYDYLNGTSTREPLMDSYMTDDIRSGGFHARPVVGGLFIKMLADPVLWRKWAARDTARVSGWADLPPMPKIVTIVPAADTAPQVWRYTTACPTSAGWMKPGFDDTSWRQGPSGFGSKGTPSAIVGTPWHTSNIWLRRTVTLPDRSFRSPRLWVYHDEDVDFFVNGVPAAAEAGFQNSYPPLEISSAARALLRPGAIVTLAVHCRQTTGGQGVDVGLVSIVAPPSRPVRQVHFLHGHRRTPAAG